MSTNPKTTVLGGTSLTGGGGGVDTLFPASQLKYSTDWAKSIETRARIYVQLNPNEQSTFLANFQDADTKSYVKAVTGSSGYIDFLLGNIQEQDSEKVSNSYTINDDYVAYFYGRNPPTYNYSGLLFSTVQDDWWTGFYTLYQQLLRGTKLAGFQRLVSLRYDSKIVTGSLCNFSGSMDATQQMAVPFSFSLLVKQVQIVKPIQQPNAASPLITSPVSAAFDITAFTAQTSPENNIGSQQLSGMAVDVVAALKAAPPMTPTEVTVGLTADQAALEVASETAASQASTSSPVSQPNSSPATIPPGGLQVSTGLASGVSDESGIAGVAATNS